MKLRHTRVGVVQVLVVRVDIGLGTNEAMTPQIVILSSAGVQWFRS